MTIVTFIGYVIELALKIWDTISNDQAAAKAAQQAYKLTQDKFAAAAGAAITSMRNQAAQDSGSDQDVENQIDKQEQKK